MAMLPDDLWNKIMAIGIETKAIDYKGICCLSVTCRRLHRLAGDDSIWSSLLLSDFPRNDLDLIINDPDSIGESSGSTVNGEFKSLYKIRYEKGLAHRRFILRLESDIDQRLRQIQEREVQASREKEKMNKTIAELRNLRKAS